MTLRSDGPPPQRAWAERNPVAAARLTATREALTAFAAEHAIPVENVLSPDPLRRVIWTPPPTRRGGSVRRGPVRRSAPGTGRPRWSRR